MQADLKVGNFIAIFDNPSKLAVEPNIELSVIIPRNSSAVHYQYFSDRRASLLRFY